MSYNDIRPIFERTVEEEKVEKEDVKPSQENNGLRKSKNRLKRQAPGEAPEGAPGEAPEGAPGGSQSESVSSLVSQDYRRKCDAAEKAYEAKREKNWL
ncbi:hypothetical protein Tco_0054750 [Tanacetum coccineum]